MIALRPFRAWRPAADKAHLVGSRSYVSYTPEQLAEKLASNPYTFLHVLHPPLPAGATAIPRSDRFHAVRMAFKRFCDQGILLRDDRPALYLYAQTSRGNTSIGIIAGVSVADYRAGRIKVHEQTLTAREQLFAEYLSSTGINAEPVLLATAPGSTWDALFDPVTATRPDFDLSTTDRVRHRLWTITDRTVIEALQRAFAEIPALYIADGHHRMASSARLAEGSGATDVDPLAWCLAYIVPHRQLYIYNFDRTVNTLNGLSESAFLEALREAGTLTAVNSPQAAPGVIAVRSASGWYRLEFPPAPPDAHPADRLDAARLTARVLAPLLGIHDLRTDDRIGFVPGTLGTAALDHAVDSGTAKAAFHLHPVTFDELRAVADAQGTMPPKSTWIEPKLRSGFTVYGLEDV
jgi:uncharacterized protein (DUF1015 family)